jgi:hypothetical protein
MVRNNQFNNACRGLFDQDLFAVSQGDYGVRSTFDSLNQLCVDVQLGAIKPSDPNHPSFTFLGGFQGERR